MNDLFLYGRVDCYDVWLYSYPEAFSFKIVGTRLPWKPYGIGNLPQVPGVSTKDFFFFLLQFLRRICNIGTN